MKSAPYVTICLVLLLSYTPAFTQSSSYDPAPPKPPRAQDSFMDFALKQINPGNADYGCKIDELRKLAVDETIRNTNSWTLLIAVSFLVCAFLMLLHQHREASRREVIAAVHLARYHNAWLDARTQAEHAIHLCNELMNSRTRSTDPIVGPQTSLAEIPKMKAGNSDCIGTTTPQSIAAPTSNGQAKPKGPARDSRQTSTTTVTANMEPNVDLIAQLSTLQQQLSASHEREKNLQRELSRAHRRWQAEAKS